MSQVRQAVLVLSDGTVYKGWSSSNPNTVSGEIVFNTGMTGYQEILTDPSYYGQIVTFTYPEIGNTGVNLLDIESNVSVVKAVIVKNLCYFPCSWRSNKSFVQYLNLHNIMCIHGLDTRLLTKHLRTYGSMNGVISNQAIDYNTLLQQSRSSVKIEDKDLVQQVTTSNTYQAKIEPSYLWYFYPLIYTKRHKIMKVVVIDFGVKTNILRRLHSLNCEVVVVPAYTTSKKILAYQPNGILLSNGPGNPSKIYYGINTIKELLNYTVPIFGICMGHQLLSIALGCNTYKLKFGHRGLNHPIGWMNKAHISSQNHGFAVNRKSLTKNSITMLHVNFNDNTVAGISHRTLPIISVQYHPEASPGPHDSDYLFMYFLSIMYQCNK